MGRATTETKGELHDLRCTTKKITRTLWYLKIWFFGSRRTNPLTTSNQKHTLLLEGSRSFIILKVLRCYLPENFHFPPWQKENHLQKCQTVGDMFGSQEGIWFVWMEIIFSPKFQQIWSRSDHNFGARDFPPNLNLSIWGVNFPHQAHWSQLKPIFNISLNQITGRPCMSIPSRWRSPLYRTLWNGVMFFFSNPTPL